MLFKPQLLCFGANEQTPVLPVTYQHQATKLIIRFDISVLTSKPPIWPTTPQNYLAQESTRHDYLWENTCFEVFLQAEGSHAYHEINASPQGYWNVYRFDGYRQPAVMPPQREPMMLLKYINIAPTFIELTLDTRSCFPNTSHFRLGLCVVLPGKYGLTYWALQHSRPQADFHQVADWILSIT